MGTASRWTLIILLSLAVPLIPFAIIGELPGERWLSANDDSAWQFALTGAGLLAADLVLPIPSSLIGTLLGARLGFWPGFLSAWLGMSAGHLVGYGVGRFLLQRWGSKLPAAPGLAIVFLTRPVPVLAEAATVAAGAAKLRFLPFALATLLGNGVYAAALAGNGAALLPDTWAGPGLVLPMLLPAVAWFGGRYWERRQEQRRQ